MKYRVLNVKSDFCKILVVQDHDSIDKIYLIVSCKLLTFTE